MKTDADYPRFANEFRHVVVTAYDQLASMRERNDPEDASIVQLRADALDGTSACLFVGSERDMDEFLDRLTFASDAPASMTAATERPRRKESLMTKMLDWTKKVRRQKKAKAVGPVDAARLLATSIDGTLLAICTENDKMIALIADYPPSVARTYVPGHEIPDPVSRVHAYEMREDGHHEKVRTFDRSFEASIHYAALLPENERDVFQSALMFADARWMMGAFSELNDAFDLVPLVNPNALDSIRWNDPARLSQLLALAVTIGPAAYGKIALHPRMDGIKPDEKGLMMLASSYFGTDEDAAPVDPAPSE